jgi:hypothetical protein
MRTIVYVALWAVLATMVWLSPTVAKHSRTTSVDPLSMMANTTNLPTEKWDLF